MSPIRSLGVVWWAWKGALGLAADLRPWTPLALASIARLLVLLALVFFHRPEWVGALAPLVEAFGGPDALHYPDHLLLLPRVFGAIDLWIVLLVGTPAVAAALLSASSALAGVPESFFGFERRDLVRLLLVVGVLVLIGIGIDRVFFLLLPEGFDERGGKLGLALLIVKSGLLVLVASPFVHAPAAIVVAAESAGAAISRSIRIARAQPLTALVLTALPAFAVVPFHALAGPVGRPRLEDLPEAMVPVIAVQLVVEMIVIHGALAATSRVVLWNVQEEA